MREVLCKENISYSIEQLDKASKLLLQATKNFEDAYAKLAITLSEKLQNLTLEMDKAITSPMSEDNESNETLLDVTPVPKTKPTGGEQPTLMDGLVIVLIIFVLSVISCAMSKGLRYLMYENKPRVVPPAKIQQHKFRNLRVKPCGCPLIKLCSCNDILKTPDINQTKCSNETNIGKDCFADKVVDVFDSIVLDDENEENEELELASNLNDRASMDGDSGLNLDSMRNEDLTMKTSKLAAAADTQDACRRRRLKSELQGLKTAFNT